MKGERDMKKVIIMVVALSLFLASAALAGDDDYLLKRMWTRQEAGIEGVLRCFRDDCPPDGYRDHLLQIVSSETNLMAYGVSPRDRRLVSGFASDVKSPADYPVFAYRLFKRRLNELTGFAPSPWGSFRGSTFKVSARGGTSKAVKVSFE